MTDHRLNGSSPVVAWCDQRAIELLRTSLHPAPRLFPPLDEECLTSDVQPSLLRRAAAAATVCVGPLARRLLSWRGGVWAGAAR